MTHDRDPNAARKAFGDLLQYFRREPTALYLAGPISLWLCGGYSLDRVEAMLQGLVEDGVLRAATKEELRQAGCQHGYRLTLEGLEKLPPEDRSYGVI